MARTVAVLDTCVLFSSLTRSLLLQHAEAGCFRAIWSAEILQELSRNLRLRAKCTIEQVDYLLTEMSKAFPDASLSVDLPLVDQLKAGLRDPDDAHVIAAAILGHADSIVTSNLKDFPKKLLASYGLEAVHPDEFLLSLLDEDEVRSKGAILDCFRSMQKSRPSWADYLQRLAKVELKTLAQRLSNLEIDS